MPEPEEDKYDVFAEEERGPIWRASFSDLESAKAKAQSLATEEGMEFFVFRFRNAGEIARFFPKRR